MSSSKSAPDIRSPCEHAGSSANAPDGFGDAVPGVELSLAVADETLGAATEEHIPEARAELLEGLEEDVCGEIEDEVRESGEMDPALPASRYYYEGISWFLNAHEEGRALAHELLPLFMAFWVVEGRALAHELLPLFMRLWDEEGRALAHELLPLFMSLWDVPCVRTTFTLTMHRFIFGSALALAHELLPLFMSLWDVPCVRTTFTLTMHRFIFGVCVCV
ncbi:hypothetical protein T484DRAFT_1815967 [Baffinella frigidus]|nr:hypothetical protein T484DRAFT_1815967 [Cryptophyta sp. CCMP2293]